MSPGPLDRDRAEVLRVLLDLVQREGGYRREGVWGWAGAEEIGRILGRRIPERLPTLYARGLVERRDVRDPRRTLPLWVYRINQRGADRLATSTGGEAATVPPLPEGRSADEPRIWLPQGSLDVLTVLRQVADEPGTLPEHVPGETGWILATEIQERVRALGPGHGVYPEHVALLTSAALAMRREVVRPGKAMRLAYRITSTGRDTLLLEWREPSPATP